MLKLDFLTRVLFCLKAIARGERISDEMEKFNELESGENTRYFKTFLLHYNVFNLLSKICYFKTKFVTLTFVTCFFFSSYL